jgi:diguanylate cyclase (GGDEF)-like protein
MGRWIKKPSAQDRSTTVQSPDAVPAAVADDDEATGSLLLWTSDRLNRMMVFAAWTTPPGALLFSWILSQSGVTNNVRIWLIAISTISMINFLISALYLSSRKRGWQPPRWWVWGQSVPFGALGVCWGLSMRLTVSSLDSSLHALALVFSIAAICIGLVSSGAAAQPFFAYTLGIAAPMLGSMATQGEQWMSRMIAPTTLFVCVILMLHLEVRRGALAEASLGIVLDRDNADLAVRNQALQQVADTDDLTGLVTRQRFMSVLDRMLERARFDSSHIAVLFIDIDHFKTINDTLGHEAGDHVLSAFAKRLLDTARPQDIIGRLGGDEIALAIGPLAQPDDAYRAAERLCIALRAPYKVGDRDVLATASVGVAVGPQGISDGANLVANADAALYRAKEQGRNRVAIFDDELRRAVRHREERKADFRRAIASGEIVPFLQPIIDLQTGKISGAEALARWVHPEQGVLPASKFVQFAEDNGLGDALNEAMMNRIVELRRTWQLRGIPAGFRIRMNISPAQLTRPGSLEELLTKMMDVRCPATGISVEITETAVLTDLTVARAEINRVRAAGVTVELDDFGVGASSLSLLHELPLDVIKLDRSFVSRLPQDRRSLTLIRAVVMIAHELDLTLTAEGVETHDQLKMLRSIGVNRAQGFLFAPAVHPDVLLEHLLNGTPLRVPESTQTQARPSAATAPEWSSWSSARPSSETSASASAPV